MGIIYADLKPENILFTLEIEKYYNEKNQIADFNDFLKGKHNVVITDYNQTIKLNNSIKDKEIITSQFYGTDIYFSKHNL